MLLDESVVSRNTTALCGYWSSGHWRVSARGVFLAFGGLAAVSPRGVGENASMRGNYINGTWSPSADPGGIDVVNPADQSVIDRVPAGHPADVDDAVAAARGAFAGWAATPVAGRAERLDAVRQLLEERADSMAATI